MSEQEEVERIGKISRNKGTNAIVDADQMPESRVQPNKEKFDEALTSDGSLQARHTEGANNNLMDELHSLNRQVDSAARATPSQLADQSRGVITQIEEIKLRLSDPAVEIGSDYKRILRNKLEHIDSSLKVALDKAGLEYLPPQLLDQAPGATPVTRFLDMLTSGQDKLKSLGGQLRTIGENNESISPANLLLVQIKVNTIQQEIELFTSLLNKALEGTKTIMNVQV